MRLVYFTGHNIEEIGAGHIKQDTSDSGSVYVMKSLMILNGPYFLSSNFDSGFFSLFSSKSLCSVLEMKAADEEGAL